MVEKNREAAEEQSLRRQFEELEKRAARDELSGLLNRAAAEQYIASRLEEMRAGESCALFIVDLDDFKRVNDTLGHQAGDQAIRRSAQILSGLFHAKDIVARLGGDEFIIILPTCTAAQAEEHARAIQQSLREYNRNNSRLPLFLGIGHATWNGEDAADLYSTIHTADIRMQEKKRLHHADAFTFLRYWLEYHTGRPVRQRDSRCSSRS